MTSKLRIAIADDEADMRDFLARMLPRCGHEVVSSACTGKELVEHCKKFEPDLVITDVKMPELDGIEASLMIYQRRPVPVVLVSAYHDEALIERAEADHVLAYLVKPITIVDLQPAISVAMRRFTELESLRLECDDLRQSLTEQKLIDRAQDILMRIAQVDETQALRRLHNLAIERNTTLVDASSLVVGLDSTFSPEAC